MPWCFAIINNRLAEIFYEGKRLSSMRIYGHAYVNKNEYKTKTEQRWIEKDIEKFKFSYRKGRYMPKNRIPLDTPGEILLEEFLKPMGISQYELAKAIKVPQIRISEIVRGMRAISPDTSLRLGQYFKMSPNFWLNLQNDYDLRIAKRKIENLEIIPFKKSIPITPLSSTRPR